MWFLFLVFFQKFDKSTSEFWIPAVSIPLSHSICNVLQWPSYCIFRSARGSAFEKLVLTGGEGRDGRPAPKKNLGPRTTAIHQRNSRLFSLWQAYNDSADAAGNDEAVFEMNLEAEPEVYAAEFQKASTE